MKKVIIKNILSVIMSVLLIMCYNEAVIAQQKNKQETLLFDKISETDIHVLGNFLDIEENHAYISTQEGLISFDISDPNNPKRIGSLNFGSAFNLDVKDDFAYILSDGVVIADVSNPGNYSIVTRYNGNYSNIKVRGPYSFLSVLKKGFEIVDFSNSSSPQKVGQFFEEVRYSEEWMGYQKFDFSGDYMYLGEADHCVKIIDVSDISNPNKINRLPVSDCITDIKVHNDLLAVGTMNELILYDVSDPEFPVKKASLNSYQPCHINTDGNILIFYDDNKTYKYIVVDISDPKSPEVIFSYDPSYSHEILLKGDYLYCISKKFEIFKINYNKNK